jgi:hypothetical protein
MQAGATPLLKVPQLMKVASSTPSRRSRALRTRASGSDTERPADGQRARRRRRRHRPADGGDSWRRLRARMPREARPGERHRLGHQPVVWTSMTCWLASDQPPNVRPHCTQHQPPSVAEVCSLSVPPGVDAPRLHGRTLKDDVVRRCHRGEVEDCHRRRMRSAYSVDTGPPELAEKRLAAQANGPSGR